MVKVYLGPLSEFVGNSVSMLTQNLFNDSLATETTILKIKHCKTIKPKDLLIGTR